LALPIALTTLPENDGCRSPKKLVDRPSARIDVSTAGRAGLARPCTTAAGAPLSSSRRKNLPSSVKWALSSRASTVLGEVPAAIRIMRAGSVAVSGSDVAPSAASRRAATRRPLAWP
jgi:hypothetical protein